MRNIEPVEDLYSRDTAYGPVVPQRLLVRLKARIARRPGRWRRRMQPRSRRKRQSAEESA